MRVTVNKLFKQIPWAVLIPVAVLLGLAPFRPEPHLLEKLRMLAEGQLIRPVDIFDLILHGAPLLLVLGKLLFGRDAPRSTKP
ncbi:MAG: RND transporter [Desulfuromonadales bacterium]|nr:RND transporter [Desulfuromonadales bacterium]